MRTSTKMFIFAAGVVVGTAASWFYAKKYWMQVADEEIESMKEWVKNRLDDQKPRGEQTPDETANPKTPSAKPDLMEYAAKIKGLGYTDYSRTNEPVEKEEKEEVEEFLEDYIYVIKPELFGEEDGYEEISLTYYADGVLTDERDNVIEDADSVVGPDFASYYGYYESDAVYVRDDHMKIDYEILRDNRKFSDVVETSPYPMEDE